MITVRWRGAVAFVAALAAAGDARHPYRPRIRPRRGGTIRRATWARFSTTCRRRGCSRIPRRSWTPARSSSRRRSRDGTGRSAGGADSTSARSWRGTSSSRAPPVRAFGRDNPDASLYMVMVGGACMLIAALRVMRVHDAGDRDIDEEAVIEADEHQPLGIQGSAQPVPSTGLIDEEPDRKS
jgi:hypothetical protein